MRLIFNFNIADSIVSMSYKENSKTMYSSSKKYYMIENDELKYQVPSISTPILFSHKNLSNSFRRFYWL